MHLANARQTKVEDSADDELPSTSGTQFTESSLSESLSSQVPKVLFS